MTAKRIWLTGASSGIGLALARELAREGHQLAVTARSREPLDALADEFPGQITVLRADLTDHAQVQHLGEQLQQQWGALDLAILNAGTCEYVDVNHFDSALFARVLATNLQASVHCIEAALPLLRQGRQPRLVGVGSSVTFCPLPRAAAYGASKAGMRYLLQSLELDLAQWQIAVSLVSPGFVDTPLTAQNDFPMPMRISSEAAARKICKGIAKGRREIRFPTVFIGFLRLLGSLPGGLRFAMTKGLARPSDEDKP